MRNAEFRHLLLGLAIAISWPGSVLASELRPATAVAFDHYVQRTEERMRGELADPERFLYTDTLPERKKDALLARLHSGEVVIERMRTDAEGEKIDIPHGLVHHWLALGFIPGATRDQAMALAQDYARHAQLYAPDVQRAEILSHEDQHFTVYFRFYRKTIVTAVYNTEFSADYFRPDSSRGYSVSRAVRIAEVQNPGKPDEKELPVGNDRGYMWRLNLYSRYLEKDDGVYIQIEFLALSRSVPAIFAWLVNPYIRSVPRDYLSRYVSATRRALNPTTPAS